MKEDNSGPKYFKGDNEYGGMGVSVHELTLTSS